MESAGGNANYLTQLHRRAQCRLGRVSGPNSHSRASKRLDLRPDRLKQSCDAEDAHNSFEVVGEHMKAHFGTYPRKCFGQEVGTSHPIFERSKRMFDGLPADSHFPGIMFQPKLHGIEYSLMFTAFQTTLFTRRALLSHRAGLTARVPITVQQHPIFHRRKPSGQ